MALPRSSFTIESYIWRDEKTVITCRLSLGNAIGLFFVGLAAGENVQRKFPIRSLAPLTTLRPTLMNRVAILLPPCLRFG